jgi:hypothetical protein
VRKITASDALGAARAAFNILACDSTGTRAVLLGDPGGPPTIPYLRRLEYPLASPGVPAPRLAKAVNPTGRFVMFDWTASDGEIATQTSTFGRGFHVDYHSGTREPATITLVPSGRVVYQSSALAQPTLLPTTVTGGDGATIKTSYDALGRITSVQRGAETMTITRADNALGTTVCGYVSNTASGVAYQNVGCVVEDERGRPIAAQSANALTLIENLSASGLVSKITWPSGDTTDLGYDGELVTSVLHSGEPSQSMGYSAAFKTSQGDGLAASTFGYTDYGALASADDAVAAEHWTATIAWTPDHEGFDLSVNGAVVQRVRGATAPEPPALSCGSL